MIRALFLDAAGTLIEPLEAVAAVYARAAGAEGLEVKEDRIRGAFREVFGGLPDPDWAAHKSGDEAERAWWRRVVQRTLTTAAGEPVEAGMTDRCFQELFEHYAAPSAWRVFPEVGEALESARRRGWKTAVVSNFDRRLHGILAGHGLEFDAVVTSADARARKPEAAIFREALRLTGTQAGEVLHAGDSAKADVEGARALGIRAYLVERPEGDLRGAIQEGDRN